MKSRADSFSLNHLSIQKRLPLLICALLLSAITIYGFANYYGLKKATLAMAGERLSSLTGQISAMFGQSAQSLIKMGNATAAENTLIACLKSNGKDFNKETVDALNKLHHDSTWLSTTLVNSSLAPVVRLGDPKGMTKIDLRSVLKNSPVAPGSTRIGRIFRVTGAMYFPIITSVTEHGQIIGYIVTLIALRTSQQAVTQFSKLVGTSARFYIVNADGSLWTNMMKPVHGLPISIGPGGKVVEYTNADGRRMMAGTKSIAGSDWVVVVEFPEDIVLNGLTIFVKWTTVIGLTLTAIGIFAAWVMSRNITKPLNQLTVAATAISQGNYSILVPADLFKGDELGKLANAFNIMTARVYQMHHELETKVAERTAQLENVNKELEAFSYSVSHDLRTPLRAVNGYAVMLKEDYGPELDAEGTRIIRNIITNAKMMGQLIDDLLSFSRLGKKELVRTQVDMRAVAVTVVNELLQHDPVNKYRINVGPLPTVEADQVMIKQVLVNLVSNAIKYASKKDVPEIEIGSMDEDTKTVYYVKDNGAGFEMAYASKLFGVFQRLHSQEEFEGSGVGLALVKRIIEKHKGQIWAEGKENKGAVFYFSLPKN